MILLLFFLSVCFASPDVPVFRKGKKMRVVMTYGAAVEGGYLAILQDVL